jgi:hypothetical protein
MAYADVSLNPFTNELMFDCVQQYTHNQSINLSLNGSPPCAGFKDKDKHNI